MLKKKFLYILAFLLLFICLNCTSVFADEFVLVDEYNNMDLSRVFELVGDNNFFIVRSASHNSYNTFIVPYGYTVRMVSDYEFSIYDTSGNSSYFDYIYCYVNAQRTGLSFRDIQHSHWYVDNFSGGPGLSGSSGCIFYSTVDIYDTDGTIFFQAPLTLTPLAKIVEESNPKGILGEIIVILPLIIVVVVSFLGLRKALTLLLEVFHRA